jgi:hypothetical protein
MHSLNRFFLQKVMLQESKRASAPKEALVGLDLKERKNGVAN